ncbi:hypothetical protein CHUAL_010973 [Chamberlinius hualienensis]
MSRNLVISVAVFFFSVITNSLKISFSDDGRPPAYFAVDDIADSLPDYLVVKYNKPPNFKNFSKILLWTPTIKDHSGNFLQNKNFAEFCPSINCQIVTDRTHYDSSDGVIFDANDFSVKGNEAFLAELPSNRRPEQRWVYFSQSPPSQLNRSRLNGLFNWTVTYKRDSDVVAYIYNRLVFNKLVTPELRQQSLERNYVLGKTKTAWIRPNSCKTISHRESYVKSMKSFLGVDIYGDCGEFKYDNVEFYRNLSREYKFYLVFEDDICTDYVTDEFSLALSLDVVPVVFGGANYTKIAPLGSYINALNFPNAHKLAQYLRFLDNNDYEYNKYFDWKRGSSKPEFDRSDWLCDLCLKLMDPTEPPKTYSNLDLWWNRETDCKTLQLS